MKGSEGLARQYVPPSRRNRRGGAGGAACRLQSLTVSGELRKLRNRMASTTLRYAATVHRLIVPPGNLVIILLSE